MGDQTGPGGVSLEKGVGGVVGVESKTTHTDHRPDTEDEKKP